MNVTSLTPPSNRRFIEFLRMQAQQILLFLGKIPNPTGKMGQNFEAARLFIDQLEMLQEKTKGNLNLEESETLNLVLSEVRLAYVQTAPTNDASTLTPPTLSTMERHIEETTAEKKKKFSKSYGS